MTRILTAIFSLVTLHTVALAQLATTVKEQALSKNYELISYLTTDKDGCNGFSWFSDKPGLFQWNSCGKSTTHEFIVPEGCTPVARETTKNGNKSGYRTEQQGNRFIVTLSVPGRSLFGPNHWIGVAVSCQ